MNLTVAHFEHAMPALAELGLEHLVPAYLRGGQVLLDQEALALLMSSLSGGAQKHAARRLVAVLSATAAEVLAWELNAEAQRRAEDAAALLTFTQAQEIITPFFAPLGDSLSATRASSATGTENAPQPAPEKLPTPIDT